MVAARSLWLKDCRANFQLEFLLKPIGTAFNFYVPLFFPGCDRHLLGLRLIAEEEGDTHNRDVTCYTEFKTQAENRCSRFQFGNNTPRMRLEIVPSDFSGTPLF